VPDPQFDPRVWVLGPDLATEVASEDGDTVTLQFVALEAGTYTVLIADRDNGGGSAAYGITVNGISAEKAELTVALLTVSPASIEEPNTAVVSWTIENMGLLDATPLGCLLEIRFSSDYVFDDLDDLIDATRIDTVLEPQDTLSGAFILEPAVYGARKPGEYWVVAKVDTEDIVDEISEINNTAWASVIIEPGCFPFSHPDYAQWVAVGQPECWCLPRQCHGDADGLSAGDDETGYSYVESSDLNILIEAWLVKEPPDGPGIVSVPDGICADFAHNTEGNAKTGFHRVGPSDLNTLVANWLLKEPPHGEGVPPDCLQDSP